MSSEGSLTCHTYCDMGLPFIMVISEDPWNSHLLPSVWQWSCHYLFLRLRSVATGDRTPISRIRGERSTSTPLPLISRVFSKFFQTFHTIRFMCRRSRPNIWTTSKLIFKKISPAVNLSKSLSMEVNSHRFLISSMYIQCSLYYYRKFESLSILFYMLISLLWKRITFLFCQ